MQNNGELQTCGRSVHGELHEYNKNFNFLVFLGVPMVIMELFVMTISMNVKFLVYVHVMEMENVSIQQGATVVAAMLDSLVKTVL